MTGQYQHSIDAKGRLFIPAKLREELGDTFYVTVSLTDPCLYACSEEEWEKMTVKIEALPQSRSSKLRRYLYSNAVKCDPDAQGRILLPQKLRQLAGLEKETVIAGVSAHAEIWNADKWAQMESEEFSPESLAALSESLNF